MRRIRLCCCVIAVLLLVTGLLAQAPEPITDPDAYAIYSKLVIEGWPEKGEPILLQRETTIEPSRSGTVRVPDSEKEWVEAKDSFVRENATTRLLQPLLGTDVRLISKLDILADDARLALKYPGIWQHRPESMEYAAVSVVGFNAKKDKAIVYVRFRSRGDVHFVEKREGAWVRPTLSRGFGAGGWIASLDPVVAPTMIHAATTAAR